jgi:hypothetical protein
MSYTFNEKGGTNHGIKTYNQIFAPDRGVVSSASYWNPTLISGDTVLCKMQYTHASNVIDNYKLLTWYDFDQGGSVVYGAHWIGTGIYLCYCNSSSGWGVSEFVCQPKPETVPTPSPGTRSIVQKAIIGAQAEQPMGVALEPASAKGDFATVAMMGVWPAKRFGTLTLDSAVYSRLDNTGRVTATQPVSYASGAMSKALDINYPVVSDNEGNLVDGALICIWGTAAEQW